jgi:hypothetical protein
MPDLIEDPPIQRKTPAMPLRLYPVIAVLLMLLFAGNHEARAQDTCATAVAIEHDSTHSITMLPGIDPEDYDLPYRKPDPYRISGTSVKIFPNPASHRLTVEFAEETDQIIGYIEIFNVYGQLIQKTPIDRHTMDLSVTSLPPGMHYYKVTNQGYIVGSGKMLILR